MKKIVCSLAFPVILSGCSLMAGPAPTGALHDPAPESLAKMAGSDWTNFKTLSQADTRLAGMTYALQDAAREKEKIRLTSGDIATVGAITSVIAGASGEVTTAAIGAGLAGLLGIGDQRYQLAVQRSNMINAAKAFQCVRESIHGVDDSDLDVEFYPNASASDTEKTEIEKLNELRFDVVRMVASAAYDIRGALEEAQARVEIRQPNIEQIRQGLSQQPGQPKAGGATAGGAGSVQFSANALASENQHILAELAGKPSDVSAGNMIAVLRGLEELEQKDTEAERLLHEWTVQTKADTELSERQKQAILDTYAARLKTLAAHKKNVGVLAGSVKNFIAATLLDASMAPARVRFIESRLRALPVRLQVCRGLISAS